MENGMKLRDLELVHYSREPLMAVTEPQGDKCAAGFKPRGLWVSVKGDSDWKEWCESGGFRLDTLTCETRVILDDNHNILLLSGPGELDAFTMEYEGIPEYPGDRRIDWDLVASRYDGIVIAPYFWQRRMAEHTRWYYGWDCASGCIWNPAAIARLEPCGDPVSQGVRLNAAAGKEGI